MAAIRWTVLATGFAALTAGCTSPQPAARGPAFIPPVMAATSPDFACPWVDAERGRAPGRLASAASVPPAPFVTGCAIVRFYVAADGTPTKPALRAANPLNDGPTALAALQTMRFQPARRPETPFVLRLSMQRDSAGHITVGTETRPSLSFLF